MGKIVPDRKKSCSNNIRKKKLIKHQDNSQGDNNILMTHNISVVPRNLDYFLIVRKISEPSKNISYSKYITLFDHIN